MTVSFVLPPLRTSARSALGAAAWRALAASCALANLAGCGPSFEAIQEGDLRFAHCDRLDIDPNISPSHRLHCWREWRRVYTYGQTRDRVEYAQRRIAEVVSGDTEPGFVLPSGERPRDPTSGPSVLSPEVPPPAMVAAPATPAAPAEPAASPPGDVPASPPNDEACRSYCKADEARCAPECATSATGCGDCAFIEKCVQTCKTEGIPY